MRPIRRGTVDAALDLLMSVFAWLRARGEAADPLLRHA